MAGSPSSKDRMHSVREYLSGRLKEEESFADKTIDVPRIS
jgi:hypothetical protein